MIEKLILKYLKNKGYGIIKNYGVLEEKTVNQRIEDVEYKFEELEKRYWEVFHYKREQDKTDSIFKQLNEQERIITSLLSFLGLIAIKNKDSFGEYYQIKKVEKK